MTSTSIISPNQLMLKYGKDSSLLIFILCLSKLLSIDITYIFGSLGKD